METMACNGPHAPPQNAAAQAGSSDARGSGGTASETKQKYTLKSEGGGTYKVAGGEQINVSSSSALEVLNDACDVPTAVMNLQQMNFGYAMQVATAGVHAFVR